MNKNILHIGGYDKFTKPFIELVKENFEFESHCFLMTSSQVEKVSYGNVRVFERSILSRLKYYCSVLIKSHKFDKVILHGLFDIKLVVILFFMPWLLKKCYWVMWGGDLYDYETGEKNWQWRVNEFFRRPVIKNVANFLTYIPGDVELVRKWYGALGEHHECLMYLSNVVDSKIIRAARDTTEEYSFVAILVGNSADPSNNHIEALEKLLPYKNEDIKIFVPLSYGDQDYARSVIEKGSDWFADKFVPLTSFMEFDEYLEFLRSIDIAVFNHKRQQAMGNTITLLAMGKTIFMRNDVSQWDFLTDLGINLKSVNELSLKKITKEELQANSGVISSYFSKEILKNQLSKIFEV